MERLTYRSTKFNNPVSYGACEKIKCSAKCDSCKINDLIAKLCAYEETGMEPEQLKQIGCLFSDDSCVGMDFISPCIDAAKSGITADRLRELAVAERDGRLVSLPCKAGDTVYEISNNTDACNGCQHYEGIYGSGESWCMQIDDVDLRFYPNIAEKPLCEKQFMEVVAHKPEIDWIFTHRNDFGKTVFLTRAEAEQKLHDIKSELDAAASEHEQED